VPLKQTDLYQHQFISSLSSSMSHLRSTTRFILSQIQRQTLRKNNPQTLSRNVTALSLASKKRKGKKITMVTAYDYPSAIHVQRADIDVILVGDSVAMVELGFDNTQPMTLDQMIHHCQAVNRGVSASMNWCSKPKPKKPLLIGDMVRTYSFLCAHGTLALVGYTFWMSSIDTAIIQKSNNVSPNCGV
jgi:hypothetical protein